MSKGTGLAFVADRLGISLDRVVSFGDGENDIELIDEVGFGIAVEDANPLLLARAELGVPDRRRRRRRRRDRRIPRIARMIDLKAARADPDAWRAALARKGAGEAFDALLAADERWRAARTPRRRAAQQDEAERASRRPSSSRSCKG